ncbi:MAG: Na+/H+ antiporter [Acidobacteriota bacterium]
MQTDLVVEFIIWLLVAASIIAVVAARLRIPYTAALVLGGLALGMVRTPFLQEITGQRPDWLTPSVTLIIFLPPLLFEGSIKIQFRHLRENAIPILLLGSLGVMVATAITGFVLYQEAVLPLLFALLFGSIISATDPISVLAIFKGMPVSKRLSIIVEGESLFNDGTAAVLFAILLAGITTGSLSVRSGIGDFLVVVLGGAAIGLAFGYVISKITQRIDDPQIEITLTTILAYSSYLAADSLHLSGVIATVAAGLTIGNYGTRVGMSPRTRVALWSFWEYLSFVINSIVFLLIGLEVRVTEILHTWQATLLAIGAVLLGRAISVYAVIPINNIFAEKIPRRWQHVLVWSGMHGALSLALALSLAPTFPYRDQILTMTFGAVAFTIIVQGLTIKPLLRILRLSVSKEDDYERARVRQIALAAAQNELDSMLRRHLVSRPVYDRYRQEIQAQLKKAETDVAEIYEENEARAEDEVHLAKVRLIAAEKSSIEEAVHEGLISSQSANDIINTVDRELDRLTHPDKKPRKSA